MTAPILLIAFTAFLSLVLAGAVAVDWATERRDLRRTLRGIQDASSGETISGPREQQLALPMFGRIVRPGAAGAARLARRFSPVETYERIEQEIVHAGNPAGWDAERIFAFKVVVPFVAGGLALAVVVVAQVTGPLAIALVGLFAAAGWYAPEWIVRSRAADRQKSIQRALPDTLDLMSITVQAGLSFDAALSRVARNVKGPLGQELYRVVQEIQLGKGRGLALRDLADRSTVGDLKSFVAAMVQADAFGIPIARVLKVQSNEIRIRRRQRAEEMAQKLPVKIVFPVILTIFPSLFVILLGPAAIDIYTNIIRG